MLKNKITESTLGMVEILEKNGYKFEGDKQKFLDSAKRNKDLAYQKNADEVEHTSNTGFGEELVPTEVFSSQVMELAVEYSQILPLFRGNQGNNLQRLTTRPVIGEERIFNSGSAEWTTGDNNPGQPTKKISTDSISIQQFGFDDTYGISKELLNYSMVPQLENIIMEKISRGVSRTIDALILNGDPTTAGTGNVNSDDGAPSALLYYLRTLNGGLRKIAIDAGDTVDMSTMDLDDFIAIRKILGNFSDTDLVWITNTATHLNALSVDEVINNQYTPVQSQAQGTIVPTILGIPVARHRDFGLTEADGKQSVTPSNNVKGGAILTHKASIQYGFGQVLDISRHANAAEGIALVASFDFGFEVATELADETTPSVAMGINATV